MSPRLAVALYQEDEIDNDLRAQAVTTAIAAHQRAKEAEPNPPECIDEDITDMLADLRHLCDRHGLDFGHLDRIAYENYLSEK